MAIVLLLGCTSKQESDLLDAYDEKITYHKKLQKTEKLQLYDGGMTKAMLTATYLFKPNFHKNDSRDEVFIIGMHLEDEASDKWVKVEDSFTLNGHAAKKAVPLESDDERLREASLVTQWSSYYLVTFPHVESKSLALVFKHEAYGEGMMLFAKVGKYVLQKEIF